jgi:hypothetical protein
MAEPHVCQHTALSREAMPAFCTTKVTQHTFSINFSGKTFDILHKTRRGDSLSTLSSSQSGEVKLHEIMHKQRVPQESKRVLVCKLKHPSRIIEAR